MFFSKLEQDTDLTILCYVNELRAMILYWFNILVEGIIKLIFFCLLIRFEHK